MTRSDLPKIIKWSKYVVNNKTFCFGLFEFAKGKQIGEILHFGDEDEGNQYRALYAVAEVTGKLHSKYKLTHGDLNDGNIFYDKNSNLVTLIDNGNIADFSRSNVTTEIRIITNGLYRKIYSAIDIYFKNKEQFHLSNGHRDPFEKLITEADLSIEVINRYLNQITSIEERSFIINDIIKPWCIYIVELEIKDKGYFGEKLRELKTEMSENVSFIKKCIEGKF